MIQNIMDFWFTSLFGLLLYWLPFALCLWSYITESHRNYQTDRRNLAHHIRQEGKPGYRPTDTYGDLLGRALITIVPVANLLAAFFVHAPRMFGNFFDKIGAFFNEPVVKGPE